ncbi:MAG TPA: hypothetical protein VFB58_13890 [Chloroflexota bacterium]|nr:hypothetical protein [Chloroflexota bacterium]
MAILSNRAHIFAPPDAKQPLADLFTNALDCTVAEVAVPGKAIPFLLIQFRNGAGMTVEFVDDALTPELARRGAYLELLDADPDGVRERVLAHGATVVDYPGTPYFYFQAPGGQVFRIVPADDI